MFWSKTFTLALLLAMMEMRRSQIGDEMNYTTYSIARDVLPESKCWPCLVFRFQHQIGFQAAHLNLLFPPCLHLRFDSWFDFEKCVMNSINVLGTVHIILWVSTYIFQCIFVCFFLKKKIGIPILLQTQQVFRKIRRLIDEHLVVDGSTLNQLR